MSSFCCPCPLWLWFEIHSIVNTTSHSPLCGSANGSPGANGSPSGNGKRTKRSFQSKTFKVAISYAAKIPLKSIVLALKGSEADNNAQDALRVLDIVLRQQAATRCVHRSVFVLLCFILLLGLTFFIYGC